MKNDRFGRIGVLAGGPSSERDISLKSGLAVYEALKSTGHDVELIDIKDGSDRGLKGIRADIVFLALHGGFGEDGTVQRILDGLRIPYTGSDPFSSALALDKVASREIFREHGIPVPKYRAVKNSIPVSDIEGDMGLPVVVKPRKEGSSIGLSVVREKKDLAPALDTAFKYDDIVLIEQYIDGRELTVGILEDKPLPVIEIVPPDNVYDFDAKYLDSKTQYVVPAHISDDDRMRAQDLGVKAHKALRCRDFSRVDMRMDKGGNIFVLEVNTIPGLTERSLLPKAAQSAGISFGKLCITLLNLALKRKG